MMIQFKKNKEKTKFLYEIIEEIKKRELNKRFELYYIIKKFEKNLF